jgi:hypothetical protein
MNFTGSTATSLFQGFSAIFSIYTSLQPVFTQITTAPGVVVKGTGTATFGPTTLSVTTYGLASTPFDYNGCGFSVHLTTFVLQIGTSSGSSFQILTLFTVAGTQTSSSGTQNYDTSFKLISILRNS